MTAYSNGAINEALQKELIKAVANVQDQMNVKFITVNMDLDIYGGGSKVRFSVVPDHVLKPKS